MVEKVFAGSGDKLQLCIVFHTRQPRFSRNPDIFPNCAAPQALRFGAAQIFSKTYSIYREQPRARGGIQERRPIGVEDNWTAGTAALPMGDLIPHRRRSQRGWFIQPTVDSKWESTGMGNDVPSRQDANSGGDRQREVQRDSERKTNDALSAFVQLVASHQHRLRAYLIATVSVRA